MGLLLVGRPARPAEAGRDELIGIELPLVLLTGRIDRLPFAGGGILRFKSMKWEHFVWTPVEVGGTVYQWIDSDNDDNRGTGFGTYLGTQAGYPLGFGERSQHRLRLGLGWGLGLFGISHKESWNPQEEFSGQALGLVVSSQLAYRYEFESCWSLGASLRVIWPVAGFSSYGYSTDSQSPLYLLSVDASYLQTAEAKAGGEEPVPPDSRPRRVTEPLALEITGLQFMLGPRNAPEPPVTTGTGVLARVWTLRWKYVYLTPLEIGAGRMISDEIHSFFVGAEGGLPLCLGTREQHCLALGLGLGYGIFGGYSTFYGDDPWGMGGQGFMFSPTLRYDYQMQIPLFFGLGVRLQIPLEANPPFPYGNFYAWGIQIFLDLGIGSGSGAL